MSTVGTMCIVPNGNLVPRVLKERFEGNNIVSGLPGALLCPGQGSPTPVFSSVLKARSLPTFWQVSTCVYSLALRMRPGITEPTGRTGPTVTGDGLNKLIARVGQETALLCDVQAFPTPLMRQVEALYNKPTGRTAPKVTGDGWNKLSSHVDLEVALLCDAQAFPTPIMSVAPKRTESRLQEKCLTLGLPGGMLCVIQGYPVPATRQLTVHLVDRVTIHLLIFTKCSVTNQPPPPPNIQASSRVVGAGRQHCWLLSEPTGAVSPKVTSKTIDVKEVVVASRFVGLCPGQGFPATFPPHPTPPPNVSAAVAEPTGGVRPRVTSKTIEFKDVPRGSEFVALCPGQGFPVPRYRWYKFIESTTRKQAVTLDDRVKQVSGTLIIKEARVEDSGKYLCVVNNSVGGESVETVLTVTAPLSANIEPTTQTVDFGRPAVFTCNFEGNPIKTINWMKDGKRLNHEESVLRIDTVKKDDRGMYQCFVRNDQESAGASAELKLGGRFEPPQIHKKFSEETLQPGPSMFLQCVASGNPTPEITWELDGKKLSNSDHLQVGQYVTVNGDVVSNLNISSIHTNDGGLYKCIASSKVGSTEHAAKLNVYGLPFIRPMEKKAIVAGENLIVTCPVAGYPIDSIVWERDGRVLPINRKQKVFPNGTLIIENVERLSDQAIYTCVARNAQGFSARGTLEVQVMVAPHITPFQFDGPINAGDSVQLTCYVSKGDKPLRIEWHFHGRDLSSHAVGVRTAVFGEKANILTINSVGPGHRGAYTCTATNSAGVANFTAELDVNVPPHIIPFWFEGEANSGDNAQLTCHVSKGDRPMLLTWSFHGQDLSSHMGITTTKIGDSISVLVIQSATAGHSGNYTCTARNSAGLANHTASLQVNVPPSISPFSFGNLPMNAGVVAQIQCIVAYGDLPVTISWKFPGDNAPSSSGVTTMKIADRVSILMIAAVTSKHSGNYTCVASNDAGRETFSTPLIINEPPSIAPFSFGTLPMNAGTFANLQCIVVSGDLPVMITWSYPGDKMATDLELSVTKVANRISLLTISTLRAVHAGDYTCIASNRAGTAAYTAPLTVNVKPSILSFSTEPLNAGQLLQISCVVSQGDQPLQLTWTFHGRDASSSLGVKIFKMGPRVSVLLIDSVTALHTGNYTCTARNPAGVDNITTELVVKVLPEIVPFSFGSKPRTHGQSATVTCSVDGDKPVKVHWTLNNDDIAPFMNITIIPLGDSGSILSVPRVGASHRGVYSCVAKNPAGVTKHSAELFVDVTVLSKISPFTFGECPLSEDQLVAVPCAVVEGDSPINLKALFNNQPVSRRMRVTIVQPAFLASVQSKRCTFTCVTENAAVVHCFSANLTAIVPPHVLSFTFGDKPVNAGDMVIVHCTVVKGDSPLSITWFLNGGEVTPDYQGVVISAPSQRTSTLSIEAVRASHAGAYMCRAANAAGTANQTAALNVNVVPQILPFSFGEDPANAGDMSVVQCAVVKGDSPIKISWTLDGVEISPGYQGILISQISQRISALSIEAVKARHGGEYTCRASNEAGTTSHSSRFIVNVPPQIVPFSFGDGPANAGEMSFIQCAVIKGDSPMNITWSVNGAEIPPGYAGVSVTKVNERLSTLSIVAVQARHSGEYACVVANKGGVANHSSLLLVNVLPHIIPFPLEEEVNHGDSVQLNCHVSKGDKPLTISWNLHGRELGSHLGITTTKLGDRTSLLSISSAVAAHTGDYTCTAQNSAGSGPYKAMLRGTPPLKMWWSCLPTWGYFDLLRSPTGRVGGLVTVTGAAGNGAGLTSHSFVLIVNVVPSITPFTFGEQAVNAGTLVQQSCVVSQGDEPLTISWVLGDRNASEVPGVSVFNLGKRTSILTIETVRYFHWGTYTCVAINSAGVASQASVLTVNVPPKILPFTFGDTPLNAGQPMTVTCAVIGGDRPMSTWWTLNGLNVTRDVPGITVVPLGDAGSLLTLGSVSSGHAGNYTCTISNSGGLASHSSQLRVNVPPKILPFTFGDAPSSVGKPITVTCAVIDGDKPMTVWWTLNGHNITRDMRSVIVVALGDAAPPKILPFSFGNTPSNVGKPMTVACGVIDGDKPMLTWWTLNSRNVSREMPGITLVPLGELTAHCCGEKSRILTVLRPGPQEGFTPEHGPGVPIKPRMVAPKLLPFTFGEDVFHAGQAATLQCTITEGDLPIDIEWTLNGQDLSWLSDISTSKIGRRTSILSIEPVHGSHMGNYTCRARNAAGVASYTTRLVSLSLGPTSSMTSFPSPFSSHDCTTFSILHTPPYSLQPLSLGPTSSLTSFPSPFPSHGYTTFSLLSCPVLLVSCSLMVGNSHYITPRTCPVHPCSRSGFRALLLTLLFLTLSSTTLPRYLNLFAILYFSSLTVTLSLFLTLNLTPYLSEPPAVKETYRCVVVPPKLSPFTFGEDVFHSGQSATLQCTFTDGDLPIDIVWTLNGERLSRDSEVSASKVGRRSSVLSIDSVRGSHAGNYTCVGKNAAGVATYTAVLVVNVRPVIVPFSFGDTPSNPDDVVQLTCLVTKGDSPLNVSWEFRGPLTDEAIPRGVETTKLGDRTSVLMINPVMAEHQGNYTCYVVNSAGTDSHSATLTVNGMFPDNTTLVNILNISNPAVPVLPHIVPFHFDSPIFAGEATQVTCLVSQGDLPLDISWSFQGTELSSQMGISTSKMGKRGSSLLLDPASLGHRGNYTCTVRNRAGTVNFSTSLEIHVLPHIIPFRFDSPIFAGQATQVTCLVSEGDLPLDILWSFQGTYLSSQRSISTTKISRRGSLLLLDPANSGHTGNYSCTVRNPAGTVSFTTSLEIHVLPRIVPFRFDSPIFAGQATQVTCLVSDGDAPLDISWSFQGTDLSSQMGISTMKAGKKANLLLIDSANLGHKGNYTCTVKNAAGTVNYTASLHIHVLPKIIPFHFDSPIFAGESTQVTCMVSQGDLPLEISWSFQGTELSSQMGISTMKAGKKTSLLIIDPANRGHKGNYTCTVRNTAGTVNYTASLHIHVLPKIVPFRFDSPIFAGEATQVTCMVSQGDLPLEISWSFQGTELSSQMGISTMKAGKKTSLLIIDPANRGHKGNYTCTVRNTAGTVNYTASLHIHVLPKIVPFRFDSPIFAGEATQVTCLVSQGDPPLDISWSFQGTDLSSQMGVSTTKAGKKASMLLIDVANPGHKGDYTCNVKNPAGVVNFTTSLHIHVLPLIVPFHFDSPIFVGQATQVTCLVSQGDGPLDVTWSFQGADLSSQTGISTNKFGRTSLLLIDPAGSGHRGNYTCTVKNPAGVVNYTAHLEIHVLPLIVPFHFDSPIFAGQATQVTCLVSQGDAPLNILWSFQGSELSTQTGISTNKFGRKASSLLIDPASSGHRGNYTCTVKNPAGTVNYTAHLEIHVLPQIQPFNFNPKGVNGGSSTRTMCSVIAGDSPLNIGWLKDGQPLSESRRRIRKLDDVTVILSLAHISLDDSGNYTCVASNAAGSASHSSVLKVKEIPSLLPISLPSEFNNEGDYVQLTCVATKGDHPITFSWFLNGNVVSPAMGVSTVNVGRQTSLLIVQSVTFKHVGNYTCVASNSGGQENRTAQLVVKGNSNSLCYLKD
uniref:Ig-like domain-containing protein n=1 Tax=Timema douglasi TaxID=61478 RepID=A0A7R8VJE1_TIMDO|nr:unnamed protein product [Timema douglasi]